ncbi:hypothetical protein D0T49_08680 [Paludibacter sp. 221]|uniref:type IX secretion system protein PorQ n=1 Tax=Paludibacter sp. 221 TaxID=2302939 RepID=UPI0013CF81EA|nr:type IX secretion system protein PorQ [Paludibacter sp. 221]NDV47118.1 hypothetical protein [Paludibacter sp. 221]
MIKNRILLSILIFLPFIAFSQAGKGVYNFLDLPASSRLAALGGSNVSISDHDINFVFRNPALLTEQTNKVVSLNYANYLADINFGSAVYGMTFGEKNHMSFGIQYIDYGKFLEKTETNENPSGDPNVNTYFNAKDLGIYISYARPLSDRFTVGGTFKPIFSSYERYNSFGFAIDAGVSYTNKDILFSAGLVLRNMGTQLKGYYSDEEGQHYEPLPFDIQLGATQKLRHAPFRFSLTLHNLHKWNLKYQSTNQKSTTISSVDEDTSKKKDEPGFFDMAFRHTIIGVEFVPNNNFYVAVSYNHRRRQELSMNGFKSLAGFAFGAGIKVYKFHVGFGMTQFQVGLNSYQFSIATSLNEFRL